MSLFIRWRETNKQTMDKLTAFVGLEWIGVQCFSRFFDVWGSVDVDDGNEHLMPENFSRLRIERRWEFNRERSRFESVNCSWWEFDVLTSKELERFRWLFICNEDVRRTVVKFEDFTGVKTCSDRLTIVERLLKHVFHRRRIAVHFARIYLTISSRSSSLGREETSNLISVFVGLQTVVRLLEEKKRRLTCEVKR